MSLGRRPIDVLIVGPYPAADDVYVGRFVADQAAALAATGRVRPSVVAFENAALRGPSLLRKREEGAIGASAAGRLATADPFVARGAGGPSGVPVARLTIAAGETPATGANHRADHREHALDALLDQPGERSWSVVHAHVGHPNGAAAVRTAARHGLPLVITEHASTLPALLADPVTAARWRAAVAGAACVIAVSHGLAAEIAAAAPMLSARLEIIPNTVAVDEFPLADPSARRPNELLWVGSRAASKGMATLLRAFQTIRSERPGLTLRMIGRAPTAAEDERWRRLARELRIGDAVRFEAPADRVGVAAAMARAACFVHPSPRETFGIVAAEALATGLPVVACDSGGVAEILGDDPTALGALVPPDDPDALAIAIGATLDRRLEFDPRRLREHVVSRYGSAVVAGRIADVYDRLLAEPGRTGLPAPPSRASLTPEGSRKRIDEGRTLLVGFSRVDLDRALAVFPAWATAGLELVTTGGPGPDGWRVTRAPESIEASLTELLGHGGRRDLVSRARRVARRAARRVRLAPPSPGGDVVSTLTETIARAAAIDADGEVPALVCLGGIDYLAAAPLVRSGRVRPSIGGLSALADRRAAAGLDLALAESTPTRIR